MLGSESERGRRVIQTYAIGAGFPENFDNTPGEPFVLIGLVRLFALDVRLAENLRPLRF